MDRLVGSGVALFSIMSTDSVREGNNDCTGFTCAFGDTPLVQ